MRYLHPSDRPGPQPCNRIAGTFEEQLDCVFQEPGPDHLTDEEIDRLVMTLMEKPDAAAALCRVLVWAVGRVE